jgi:hypothetical protein
MYNVNWFVMSLYVTFTVLSLYPLTLKPFVRQCNGTLRQNTIVFFPVLSLLSLFYGLVVCLSILGNLLLCCHLRLFKASPLKVISIEGVDYLFRKAWTNKLCAQFQIIRSLRFFLQNNRFYLKRRKKTV